MIGKPRRGRYRLHGLDSPEGGAVLAEHGHTRADLERALAELERSEGIRVRSIVGRRRRRPSVSTAWPSRPPVPRGIAARDPLIQYEQLEARRQAGRLQSWAENNTPAPLPCRDLKRAWRFRQSWTSLTEKFEAIFAWSKSCENQHP